MTRVGVLGVTRLLTLMDTTVECAAARIGASEDARPIFDKLMTVFPNMFSMALDFITAVTAQQSLFDLSTIATSIHTNLTCSTEPFVTRSRTSVLAAWHQITTNFFAAPAIFVVGVDTATSGFMLAAET